MHDKERTQCHRFNELKPVKSFHLRSKWKWKLTNSEKGMTETYRKALSTYRVDGQKKSDVSRSDFIISEKASMFARFVHL